MACKGICTRYQTSRPIGGGHYGAGHKRCQVCEIFIEWFGGKNAIGVEVDADRCPCCNYTLRTKPRNLRYKAKLRGEEIKKESNRKRLVGFTKDGTPILEDA